MKRCAIAAGCQSLTIYKLEMQLKALKANQEAHAQQQMRKTQSSSTAAENTAAQMAALIRKAAAAQEAADSSQLQLEHSTLEHAQQLADAQAAVESAQQQLTHSKQVHAQQMAAAQAAVASTQQELQHASQSLAQMQHELATARQMHADHMAELQRDNLAQMASVTADFTNRSAVSDAELCELKASLALTKNQHAGSLAELQQLCCFLRDQLGAADSKHAVMLVAPQAKLAAANQLKRAIEKRGCKNSTKCRPQRSSQHPIKLPQAEPQHFVDVVQAYTWFLATIAKHPADFAEDTDLVALSSPQAELIPFTPHSTQPATPVADSDAQAATAAEAECRVLTQQLTALREKMALAQVEILVHAISVNRLLHICRESAAEQGAEHCWTESQALQQLQQQVHGVAVAVRKQHEADCIAAAADHSQGMPRYAVTDASVSKAASDYPSGEADLYDWTSEQGDSDTACELQTGSTQTAASHSESTGLSPTSSAGETEFSNGHSDLQQLTGTDADTTDPQLSFFFIPGIPEEQFRTSAAQTSIRSLSAANVAVCDTTISAVGSCHPPVDASGANTRNIGSSTDAGSSTTEISSCVTTSTGMAMATGSFGEYYESEENDLEDWTRDKVEDTDKKYYPSDEDDLDDWTCAEEEDDTQSEGILF